MLRGDFTRARKILLDARAKDPNNPIKNNLALLEDSVRARKAVR
jgi:Flp pilus assembly protein TadD